jgi:hypothetical protein
MIEPATVPLDRYVIDTLLPDLVGHDRQPSAFLVYLYFSAVTEVDGGKIRRSLQTIATGTGLSKRAVQEALRTLVRRKLITARKARPTDLAAVTVHRPWRHRRIQAA